MTEIERFERAIQKLESLIPVVKRLETILPATTKLALMLNAQTDNAMEIVCRLHQIEKAYAFVLSQTSIKLLEKEIHKAIAAEEEQKILTEKHAKKHAWGGVSKEVLKDV